MSRAFAFPSLSLQSFSSHPSLPLWQTAGCFTFRGWGDSRVYSAPANPTTSSWGEIDTGFDEKLLELASLPVEPMWRPTLVGVHGVMLSIASNLI